MTTKECVEFLKENPQEIETVEMNYDCLTAEMREALEIYHERLTLL